MEGRYVSLWWHAFQRERKRLGLRFTRVADLAGGTGEAALRFARQYPVTVVDRSQAMLARARRKMRGLTLLRQDLRNLKLPRLVDLAVCVYGGIHYLTSLRDLTKVFRQVRANLLPGGTFCFDQFTAHGLKTSYGGGRETFVGKDFVSIWTHRWDAKQSRSIIHVEGFSRRGKTWRSQPPETHLHQAFSLAQIRAALRVAGLKELRICELRSGRKPQAADHQRLIFARRIP